MNSVYRYFRDIYYNIKNIADDLFLLFKHPTRELTRLYLKTNVHIFWRNLIHPLYCLNKGITNLIVYFKVIWFDRNHDYWYMTQIMDKKLERMEKFFYSDGPVIMKAKQVGKRIRWTRKLLKIWVEEIYTDEAWDKIDKKFLKPKRKFEVSQKDSFGEVLTYKWVSEANEDYSNAVKHMLKEVSLKEEKVKQLFLKNFSRLKEWWD